MKISRKQYINLSKISSEGQMYFFESYSLLYELKKLQLDNKAEASFWKLMLNKEIIDENYIFYVKNSIYRYYDFVNKYAQMIGKFYNLSKITKWSNLKDIDKYHNVPSRLQERISNAYKDPLLKEVLIARHSMTHNQLVSSRGDYISHWVLPLNGEKEKDFNSWKKSSNQILNKSLKCIEDLLKETLQCLL